MGELIIIILFFIFLGVPIILTVLNIINLFKEKLLEQKSSGVLTMILGVLFSMILYSMFDRDFHESISIGSISPQVHRYLASWHTPTIVVLMLVGVTAFLLLDFFQDRLPPIINVLCISGLYIGFGLSIVFIVQTSNRIFEDYVYGIPMVGIFAPLFPINYILCSIRVMRKTCKLQAEKISRNIYKNRLMQKLQSILSKSVSWLVIPFILAIPLLGVLIIILILLGQQPDAFIKAFTETSDWTLSQQISPPPIEYEGHYLCTVALRGDNQLVKPTRCGVRRGVKIIVNRQLCVANAFEQVILEKLPRLHRVIRNFYDKHGYPLSKKITTEKCANLIYLLMKPLEWFFVMFLYMVDVNPENRIAMQYIAR